MNEDGLLTGKWIGEYMYGSGYPFFKRRTPVSFTIEIIAVNGQITGTCIDDKSEIDEAATIEGFIENDSISFIKKYSSHWRMDWHGKAKKDSSRASHQIHYTGRLNENTFTGYWEIQVPVRNIFGRKKIMLGTGSWMMQRQ